MHSLTFPESIAPAPAAQADPPQALASLLEDGRLYLLPLAEGLLPEVLRSREGRSFEEIAAQMGRTEAPVCKPWSRARERWREGVQQPNG